MSPPMDGELREHSEFVRLLAEINKRMRFDGADVDAKNVVVAVTKLFDAAEAAQKELAEMRAENADLLRSIAAVAKSATRSVSSQGA